MSAPDCSHTTPACKRSNALPISMRPSTTPSKPSLCGCSTLLPRSRRSIPNGLEPVNNSQAHVPMNVSCSPHCAQSLWEMARRSRIMVPHPSGSPASCRTPPVLIHGPLSLALLRLRLFGHSGHGRRYCLTGPPCQEDTHTNQENPATDGQLWQDVFGEGDLRLGALRLADQVIYCILG